MTKGILDADAIRELWRTEAAVPCVVTVPLAALAALIAQAGWLAGLHGAADSDCDWLGDLQKTVAALFKR